MKKSNVILGSAFSGLLAMVIVFMVIVRILLGGAAETEAQTYDYGNWTSHDFKLTGFTGVSVEGAWEIRIIRGDEFQITVEAPEEIRNEIMVNENKGTIHLKRLEKKSKSVKRRLKAEIRMPRLTSLQTTGTVNLDIQNFKPEHLEITVAGSSKISGSGNEIKNLRLILAGVSNVKLRGNPVTNADVKFTGAYYVEMTFSGGDLTGKAAGMGKLIYDGVVNQDKLDSIGVFRRESFSH